MVQSGKTTWNCSLISLTADNSNPWQVITNNNIYNKTNDEKRQMCWRYKKADVMLEDIKGQGTWMDSMKMLKAVSQGHGVGEGTTGTLWSFSADIAKRTLYLCIRSEYDKVYKFSF